MSAYIVEDETINKIVEGIRHAVKYGDGFKSLQLQPGFIHKAGAADYQSFGELLFTMNVEAIEQRYGKGEAESFRPLDYEYHCVYPPTAIRFYRVLSCYLYQCLEGNVPETPLYKIMYDVQVQLAMLIVQSLPEYDKIPWG